MNEPIKQLAEQVVGPSRLHGGDFALMGNNQVEKFAELIVRECMSLVSEPGPDMNDTERGILAQIKKHFGVEE
jgi:hypothetical protein